MNFYCASTRRQNVDENELIVRPTLKICIRTRGWALNGNPVAHTPQQILQIGTEVKLKEKCDSSSLDSAHM